MASGTGEPVPLPPKPKPLRQSRSGCVLHGYVYLDGSYLLQSSLVNWQRWLTAWYDLLIILNLQRNSQMVLPFRLTILLMEFEEFCNKCALSFYKIIRNLLATEHQFYMRQ
jgi:hypothetical protein